MVAVGWCGWWLLGDVSGGCWVVWVVAIGWWPLGGVGGGHWMM